MATLSDLATLLKTKINKKVDGGGEASFSNLTVTGNATVKGQTTLKDYTAQNAEIDDIKANWLVMLPENENAREGGQIVLKGTKGGPTANLDVFEDRVRFWSSNGDTEIASWNLKV